MEEFCNVEVKDLGLAAYIHVHPKGFKLLNCTSRIFRFELKNGATLEELQVEYANSCCRSHDDAVRYLRQLLN